MAQGILLPSQADLESAISLWIQPAGDLSTVKLTNKQASAVNTIGREPWGVTSGLLSSTTQSAQQGGKEVLTLCLACPFPLTSVTHRLSKSHKIRREIVEEL